MYTDSQILGMLGKRTAVAHILGVNRTTLFRWIKSGRIPAAHRLAVARMADVKGIEMDRAEFLGRSENQ